MNLLLQDVAYGFRMLGRKPAFTFMAVLSIALGIGVNTAIFTLVKTILLGPLPYAEPARVVAIAPVPAAHPEQTDVSTLPDFLTWQQRAKSFEAMGALIVNARYLGAGENGEAAERIEGEDVTPGVMPAFGVKPMMGRMFSDADDAVDNPAPVMMISYRLWQRRFGGDPTILNRTVPVNGVPTAVIAVMGPDFRLTYDNADYWAPLRMNRFQLRGTARFLNVFGRLKSGVSLAQAQGEMASVADQMAREAPGRLMDHGKAWGAKVQPIRENLFGFMSRPLLLLQGAVGLVLLIACANVAGLLLARASARQNEIAIRCALGAGRTRIFRQFLTESLMLSLLGGAAGVALAWWGVHELVALAPPFFPRLRETVIDGRVLAFSAAISAVSGLLFGAGPAMTGSRVDFFTALRNSTRGGPGPGRNRLRRALVTLQLAMALMLLTGAGLLVRSFMKIQHVDLGCDPHNVLTFGVRMPQAQFGKPVGQYEGIPLWEMSAEPAAKLVRILDRVATVPGVQSASGTLMPPFVGALTANFTVEGRPAEASGTPLSAEYHPVAPGFFATMKTPLLRGRDFTARDVAGSPWVAIVNETMARRFWPNEDPIGKRIRLDIAPDEQSREIVAVARDVPSSRLQTRQEPAVFIHFVQAPPHIIGPIAGTRTQLTFVVRTAGSPMALVAGLRAAVAEIDRDRPLVDVKTAEQYMGDETQYPRYYSMLLGLFAAVATALAAVGIYGVMAYAMAQRTREIGIRMALGATRAEVARMALGQAAPLIAGGVVVGILGAAGLTRYLTSELWEVTATDPVTFAVVSVGLAVVAGAACIVPVRRATRVDPIVALRWE